MPIRLACLLISLFAAVACTPLALSAPFTQDPEQRRAFVESISIGQTTKQDLVSRWGNVTSGGTAEAGPSPDQYWNWASGLGANGASVSIIADYNGVVKSVQSGTVNVPDNFVPQGRSLATPAAATAAGAAPTTAPVAAQASEPKDDNGGIFGLECLIFCI